MEIQFNNIVLTVQEACKLLDCSYRTYYAAKLRGDLPQPAIKRNGKRYFAKEQLVGLKIKRPRGGRRT